MRRHAALVAACWIFLSGFDVPGGETAGQSGMTEVDEARPLLHTVVHIRAYGPAARAAVDEAFAEMERINSLLNNYDPVSEVSELNRRAGGDPVPVGPETMAALQRAVYFGELSGGAFDVTIGPLVALWGFDREIPGIHGPDPDPAMIGSARVLVDYRMIELSPGIPGGSPTARLARPGMWIDIGAYSKGFVADRAMEVLHRHGITSALIAAGGTIITAGAKPDGAPWQIGIRHPRRDDSFLTRLPMTGGTVSTSGDYERYYTRQGARRPHIIDPRSGLPVSHMQAVTVTAPSGDASDALSTALFVLDVKEGLALVEQLDGVEALLVTASGTVVTSSGWPAQAAGH